MTKYGDWRPIWYISLTATERKLPVIIIMRRIVPVRREYAIVHARYVADLSRND